MYGPERHVIQIAVTEAKGLLLDLVRRAEAGEDIVLTRHGDPIVRLVAVAPTADERHAALAEAHGAARGSTGPCAARSQDFLYDEQGIPG
jgi:prevent-host-death family protein